MAKEIIDVGLGENEEEAERKFLLEEFLENNKLTVLILLVGIILIGAGILGFKVIDFNSSQPKVEILGESEVGGDGWEAGSVAGMRSEGEMKITVEAAGEVEKPGVYNLEINSRVNDLLTVAGGLSADADREWVGKNINLAQKLQDGVKIFIPRKGEVKEAGSVSGVGSGSGVGAMININTASESELDTLWGVGPATAQKIIENRPYQKIEDLSDKKIVKSNVWEEIKDKVTVY